MIGLPLAPTLEVNLAAIVRNYRLLCERTAPAQCAAVVKADAYGLGAADVAPALYEAGCREFFIATLEEGVKLRHILSDARIYVFHGARKGQAKDFTHHGLVPVLNSLEQIVCWNNAGPAALHVDTGMNRLGLTLNEVSQLPSKTTFSLIMSHLACANETQNPMNKRQVEDFRTALSRFPGVAVSLANSSGIFLGADYHFNLARPGCSLYGISPNTSQPNPMENTVTLSAPVLQYRPVETAQSVGYGAIGQVKAGSVLATVEMGYADGFQRILSGKAQGIAAGIRVPLIGRVSMDMISFDVSAVPDHLRTPDLRVILIGKELPVDEVAKAAGTIGYEIFTRLGSRVKRVYIPDEGRDLVQKE